MLSLWKTLRNIPALVEPGAHRNLTQVAMWRGTRPAQIRPTARRVAPRGHYCPHDTWYCLFQREGRSAVLLITVWGLPVQGFMLGCQGKFKTPSNRQKTWMVRSTSFTTTGRVISALDFLLSNKLLTESRYFCNPETGMSGSGPSK